MYLKTITVTGFKSFAAKTTLGLEPGVSAIVGPNGSGKSNLADAVRWALGEQSKSRLRLGDREEVIFGGTEKRAKASFAEVILLFNNEDGVFPLDMTEVQISRRLYRSGETEYRLAGKIVRLQDIQTLIAEAGFGASSYAVIGQGTIDTLLISSPAERKLLFDEAAGIRGAELKREASVRKLTATEANLVRLRDIQAELAPRAALLEKSMQQVKQLEQAVGRLADLRQRYVDASLFDVSSLDVQLTRQIDEATLTLERLEYEEKELNKAQSTRLRQAAMAGAEVARRQTEVSALEKEREDLNTTLLELRATVAELERTYDASTQAAKRHQEAAKRLEFARERLAEIKDDLKGNLAAAARADKELQKSNQEVARAQAELVALRQETADGTQQQYVVHALAVLKTLAQRLQKGEVESQELRLLVHKAGRLLSHATRTGEAELLQRLKAAQAHLEKAMGHRETALEHQTNITINGRSLEIDHQHQTDLVDRLQAAAKETEAQADPAALKVQLTQARQELTQSERAVAKLTDRLTKLRQSATHVEVGTASVIAEEAARSERVRGDVAATRLQLQTLSARRAELESAAKLVAARAKEWEVTPGAEPQAGDAPMELEQQLARLEADIAARREVVAANQQEYGQVTERQSELVTQIADLETAKSDLEQLVVELDGTIRRRFKENFAQLSHHFSGYFERLFGGGSAALELTEEEGTYGVQIKATPKGKRLVNLTALSGGERALAGVALLAAILTVNPSPFVVLDEIDAALDEANSGRLSQILKELSQRSQLIVITHNRQTMEAADVLFGVTMNDHHASQLLSLHLQQAAALAAR